MTPMVKIALWALRLYLLGMLILITVKFVRTAMSNEEAGNLLLELPQPRTRRKTRCRKPSWTARGNAASEVAWRDARVAWW